MTDAALPKKKSCRNLTATTLAISLLAFVLRATAGPFSHHRPEIALPALAIALSGVAAGIIAVLGTIRVRSRDVVAALCSLLANVVMLCSFWGEVSAPCVSAITTCMVNIKQIQGSKITWAAEFHKTTNDIPPDSDLFGPNAYLSVKPTCPAHGIYDIRTVGQLTTCSIHGHVP